MTDAHDQKTTVHIVMHVPEHAPRQSDPHYALFNQLKARLHKLGLMKCAIDGCSYPGPMEVHHAKCEFSLQGGVDLAKFNEFYGLHLISDDDFKAYIEGPGNAEVLCPTHHRTRLGVHELPGPLWDAIRVWKADMQPPAEVI